MVNDTLEDHFGFVEGLSKNMRKVQMDRTEHFSDDVSSGGANEIFILVGKQFWRLIIINIENADTLKFLK